MPRKAIPKAVKRRKSLANQAKASLGDGPSSLKDQEDGGKGTHDNTRLISQAIRCGWAVPEDKKSALTDRMVVIIESVSADSDARSKQAAASAYNSLRLAELKERSLALKEQELALKRGIADKLGLGDGITDEEIKAGMARLADHVAGEPRLLANATAGNGSEEGSDIPRQVIPLSLESDDDARSLAGGTA